MLLIRYRDLTYAHPSLLARLAFGFAPACRTAFLRPTSLVPSDRASSLFSEVGRADFKQSGLRRSVPCSATQNLAYLPCRSGSYGSIFRFFVRGDVSKKALPPARPPKLRFPHGMVGKFVATSRTSYRGAFLCCLKTITKLQRCFGLTLVSFTCRHHTEPRTDSVVLRPEVKRRSSLMLHCEHNQECCTGNSSCLVAARRPVFFRPSRAVTASARIIAASSSSPIVSSPSNLRFYFWTKPNSGCPIPSPTIVASGIGIG